MGDLIKIESVEIENNGTLIQIDTDKGRLFIDTNSILMKLNNFLYQENERALLEAGFEKIKGKENEVGGELDLKYKE